MTSMFGFHVSTGVASPAPDRMSPFIKLPGVSFFLLRQFPPKIYLFSASSSAGDFFFGERGGRSPATASACAMDGAR
ncbi:hypothetical protein GUJ93_ZPchr0001g33026 [Zizania palustris]|uniref:Uncharacterized protein n=1 Tax=Zizania palustris TaxID=103762 RepID=A0A8J5V8V8_ZIZPA|nr:hypothetical protein GUJ93_ZPchr0001g33026 [Zizania palustris]